MEYDIIIIGAGPAGLSTALHLAKIAPELARRVLILERARHPRPKLCAGGVLPGAEACLRGLGLDMSVVPSVPVERIVLVFEGRRTPIHHRPVTFRAVRREQFDAWLADEARARGLALREETRVRGLSVIDGGVQVETDRGTLTARAVVGADGANSIVRRSLVPAGKHQVARLLEIRLPAPPAATEQRGEALFDFSWLPAGVQGYLWDFPSPDGEQPMRTWGVYDSRIYRWRAELPLPDVLADGLARYGGATARYELDGHPLRWFDRRAQLAAPHVILAGDAAGTDPVVGEGISFALGYGEVAAQALQDAFARADFTFANYRRQVLRHRSGRYLARRALAARLLYGLRSRPLLRLVWPLIGPIASAWFIDWDFGLG